MTAFGNGVINHPMALFPHSGDEKIGMIFFIHRQILLTMEDYVIRLRHFLDEMNR